jgi:hydroxypyruvate reductase
MGRSSVEIQGLSHLGPVTADAAAAIAAALEAVDPAALLRTRVSVEGNHLRIVTEEQTLGYDLSRYRRILVIGAGKATAKMARAVEEVLGDRIHGGVISVKYGHVETLSRIEIIEAGHPVPDEQSRLAAQRIADLARDADEDTLVLCLLSGGGSALLTLPTELSGESVTLEDLRETTQLLLASGAEIQEVNCVRKHLSQVKGGRLASLLHPATSATLILSDVVGNRLDAIASGPTVGDGTTFADAMEVTRRYGIFSRLPESVATVLSRGVDGGVPETPKPGDPAFRTACTAIIGSTHTAVVTAAQVLRSRGYDTVALTSRLTGEAREVAKLFPAMAADVAQHAMPVAPPACIVAGGETTVTLRGEGTGGRNQEMALAVNHALRAAGPNGSGVYFVSVATDGTDGPTDAAGGVASAAVLHRASALGLAESAFLAANDSFHYLQRTGALVVTGPTNTNVCDLQLLFVVPPD